MNINDFISSIDNKIYNRIRQSKSDAECRRYLKEHLEAITVTYCCKSDSELLKREKCNMCNEEKDCQGHAVCEDCGGRSF